MGKGDLNGAVESHKEALGMVSSLPGPLFFFLPSSNGFFYPQISSKIFNFVD